MSNIIVSFHMDARILVSGDTLCWKDELKKSGGKWRHSTWQPAGATAVVQRGWLFPPGSKAKVMDILKQCKGVQIHDEALVSVFLEYSDKGHIVRGQTCPIKEYLRACGAERDGS